MEVGLYENGEVKVDLVQGDFVISYGGKGATAVVTVKGEYFLEKIKEAIPGQIDDTLLDILKAALKA